MLIVALWVLAHCFSGCFLRLRSLSGWQHAVVPHMTVRKTLTQTLKSNHHGTFRVITGFGVELTVNTVIVSYFFDQFGLPIEIAGIVGAVFGLMNLFCRSIGGGTSDLMGKYFGMRGRLWAYFSLQVRG